MNDADVSTADPVPLAEFRYVTRARVAFCDIDMLRHVNNVAYVRWAETIRCAYVADVMEDLIDGRFGCILANQSWTYLAPIAYRSDVAIATRVSRIGTKSFDLVYEIRDETAGRLAARGTSALVAFDYHENASVRVPEIWRERIRAYERVAPVE
jgi:acyl-CoA thioester hydrolase